MVRSVPRFVKRETTICCGAFLGHSQYVALFSHGEDAYARCPSLSRGHLGRGRSRLSLNARA